MPPESVVLGVHVADLDQRSAPRMRRELLDAVARAPGADVVLDLGAVTFLDSSGIGLLVAMHNAVIDAGGRFSVRRVQPHPLRVLTIMKLVDMLKATAADAEA